MVQTVISSRGQVVLPKAIRDKRRWKPGTKLTVEERPDGVLLRPVEKKAGRPVAELVGILKYNGPPKTIAEMNAAIASEVRRRHARGRY
jgi:AbrB family looped-hinge helix DNA binding protein